MKQILEPLQCSWGERSSFTSNNVQRFQQLPLQPLSSPNDRTLLRRSCPEANSLWISSRVLKSRVNLFVSPRWHLLNSMWHTSCISYGLRDVSAATSLMNPSEASRLTSRSSNPSRKDNGRHTQSRTASFVSKGPMSILLNCRMIGEKTSSITGKKSSVAAITIMNPVMFINRLRSFSNIALFVLSTLHSSKSKRKGRLQSSAIRNKSSAKISSGTDDKAAPDLTFCATK